jgi:large subunit ribosomal protein L19e
MEFNKIKTLAASALGVGKGRIVFNSTRLSDIKEAMTKQDIKDLVAEGAIIILEVKGRMTKISRKTRRRAGSIRKKVKGKKRAYVILTRKLRKHLAELRKQEKLPEEQFWQLRKEIKARAFKTKAHLKERLAMKEK